MTPTALIERLLTKRYGPGWQMSAGNGTVTATRGRARLEYSFKFNGGSPAWFIVEKRPHNIVPPDIHLVRFETP